MIYNFTENPTRQSVKARNEVRRYQDFTAVSIWLLWCCLLIKSGCWPSWLYWTPRWNCLRRFLIETFFFICHYCFITDYNITKVVTKLTDKTKKFFSMGYKIWHPSKKKFKTSTEMGREINANISMLLSWSYRLYIIFDQLLTFLIFSHYNFNTRCSNNYKSIVTVWNLHSMLSSTRKLNDFQKKLLVFLNETIRRWFILNRHKNVLFFSCFRWQFPEKIWETCFGR